MKLFIKSMILPMVIFSKPILGSSDYLELGRTILSDMVKIESTADMGLATKVSELSKEILLKNGFDDADLKVVGPTKTSKGLYAVYKGKSSKTTCFLKVTGQMNLRFKISAFFYIG